MDGNILGLILTLLLIGFSTAVSLLFKGEVKRKILHIGVSNFVFIYLHFFTADLIPVIGLASFAVLNIFMELKNHTKRFGMVLFPLSVIILIGLKNLGFGTKSDVALSILSLGWSDGLAAIVGKYAGKRKMPFAEDKTVIGSFVVFAVTAFVVVTFKADFGLAILCGVCACLTECYTPFGFDNISLPLVVYAICSIL